MGFPDRIERTLEVTQPPTRVWTALTTAEGLSAWFGDRASIDPRPGGLGQIGWGDKTVDLRVERVEEPSVFGFTWQNTGMPKDDTRRTYVEFTLEPLGTGTRLTVVETGFAQLPDDVHRTEYDSHVEGWGRELGELADHLDAA